MYLQHNYNNWLEKSKNLAEPHGLKLFDNYTCDAAKWLDSDRRGNVFLAKVVNFQSSRAFKFQDISCHSLNPVLRKTKEMIGLPTLLLQDFEFLKSRLSLSGEAWRSNCRQCLHIDQWKPNIRNLRVRQTSSNSSLDNEKINTHRRSVQNKALTKLIKTPRN